MFLLVALRDSSVGEDTIEYLSEFLIQRQNDTRDIEGLFLAWNGFWRTLGISGQMYLFVCAVASVGLVMTTIWKSTKHRVMAYALFMIIFGWYTNLSLMRQAIAIGCFTVGTYLLCQNMSFLSFDNIRKGFQRESILGIFFLIITPLFHTTAIYAILMLFVALLSYNLGHKFYVWAILISFLICVTALFKDAEQLLNTAVGFLGKDIGMVARYEGYADADYLYDSSLYVVLKNTLPLNFLAIFTLIHCKRKYDINERLFFWLVITSNLFYYFSYMFRMNRYFYPAACIAVTNMLWPALQAKQSGKRKIIFIIYILLETYINSVYLNELDAFEYHFCF